MATYNEPTRPLEALLYEVPELAREEITIASGEGEVLAGTVLGKITGGNYRVYDDGNVDGGGSASDGSHVAAAVSLYTVDATSAAVNVAAVVRLAAVKSDALHWHANADATAKSDAETALAAKHLIIRS